MRPVRTTWQKRELLPGGEDRSHRFRQVHQTGRKRESSPVQHGNQVLAQTTVLEVD